MCGLDSVYADYYNDNEPFSCSWLRSLIAAGELPAGSVDEESIANVKAAPLHQYHQCHFFAGIGGWPLALRLAGWPEDFEVWTGSCPCQPFSTAGKRQGADDPRHVWPEFLRLIAECRPATIFGEQVASPLGRDWLAGVRADLEGLGYAIGAADLCAPSVGAPHIRQRLFWVGHSHNQGSQGRSERRNSADERSPWEASLGNAVLCGDGKTRRIEPGSFPLAPRLPGHVGRLRGYGNAIVPQLAAEFVRAFLDLVQVPEKY